MAKKFYNITVSWNDPYPKEYKCTTEGSNIVSGTAKALRKFREENKGRRIKDINLKVLQLGKLPEGKDEKE
jgi:hypothetical protein